MRKVSLLLCDHYSYHKIAKTSYYFPFFRLQKNYAYGYDVNEYDEYGNPNIHSKHEERDGYTVKGECRCRGGHRGRY